MAYKIETKVKKKIRGKVKRGKKRKEMGKNVMVFLHSCKKTKEISCPFVCKSRLYDARGERPETRLDE